MRSRAVSFPDACCRSMRSLPPPKLQLSAFRLQLSNLVADCLLLRDFFLSQHVSTWRNCKSSNCYAGQAHFAFPAPPSFYARLCVLRCDQVHSVEIPETHCFSMVCESLGGCFNTRPGGSAAEFVTSTIRRALPRLQDEYNRLNLQLDRKKLRFKIAGALAAKHRIPTSPGVEFPSRPGIIERWKRPEVRLQVVKPIFALRSTKTASFAKAASRTTPAAQSCPQ